MKISITLLSYDHGILRQVFDVFSEMAKVKSVNAHRIIAMEGVDFVIEFMDRFHHAKEERFLFPSAIRSDPEYKHDIQGLYKDHAYARELALGMRENVRPGGDDDEFGRLTLRLVEHMTEHIHKEEDSVFPHIEAKLSEEGDMTVYKQFEDFTMNGFPENYYKRCEEFANRFQDTVMGKGYFERPG